MKKSHLWLMISMFVLCCGVMITGVYSAVSASLSMNGNLGFNMHNCMVTMQGTIYNLADRPQGQNYANIVNRPIERTIMGGEETTIASIPLDDMYFYYGAYTDPETSVQSSKVYDIVFELTFTNISQTAIQATFPAPTVGDGVTLLHNQNDYTDFTSDYVTNLVINSQTTIKFALQLDDSSSLSENIQFSWNNISFKEVIEVPQEYKDEVQGLIYTLNADGTAWSVKGDCYTELVTNSDITRAPSGGTTSVVFINNVKNSNIVIADSLFDIPVTNIAGQAFGSYDADAGCTNITSVSIPNTIISISAEAFYKCVGLTGTLTIPDSVKTIDIRTFWGCRNLTSIIVGSGVVSLGSGSFAGCTNLTNITFKGTTPPKGLEAGLPISITASDLIIYVPSGYINKYKAEITDTGLKNSIQSI